MASKFAPPRRSAQLDELDDAQLLAVLCAVPAAHRRLLPLVCRRWRALCANPAVWEECHLDFSRGAIEDHCAMYKWCVQRRGAVKRLTLVVETDEDWLAVHLVVGLLAGSLEHLTVKAGYEGLSMHSVAWLAVLRHLKSLCVDYEMAEVITSCAVFPPGLESLTLQPKLCFPHLSSLPPSLSRLARLRHLRLPTMDMGHCRDSGTDHPLMPVCRLTGLERLDLSGSLLVCLPTELSALGKLTSLLLPRDPVLDKAGLAPLTALTRLAELDLSRCQLEEVPPPVAALPALRRLLLAGNQLVGLPDGPYLSGLERLNISANRLAALPPALLNCTALQQLDLLDGGSSGSGGDRADGGGGGSNSPDAPRMALAAKELRQLLASNPGMRELRISSEAGIGLRQLGQLQSSFPKVRVIEVEPGGRGGGLGAGCGAGSSGEEGEEDESEEDASWRASSDSEEESGGSEEESGGSGSGEDGEEKKGGQQEAQEAEGEMLG